MDRISALRNVEDALAEFEAGECTLADLEREVAAVLRTYATDFEGAQRPYEAAGGNADGLVVLAGSPREARDRIVALVDEPGRFEVSPLE